LDRSSHTEAAKRSVVEPSTAIAGLRVRLKGMLMQVIRIIVLKGEL